MNVKIMGADQSVKNKTGDNYVSTVQVSTKQSRLYKVTFSPLAGMAADVYVWVFNTAAGSASSANPDCVRYIPFGASDTWDLGEGGKLFTAGIYIALSTVPPTLATTTVTDSGINKLIISADIRAG